MGFISDGALKFLEAIIKQATINCSTNTDEQALEVQALYQNWKDYPDGYEFKADRDGKGNPDRVNYFGVLYKIIQDHTKQSTYNPKDATSLFTPIKKETETGTIDNPITWVSGMECEEGLYYIENDVIYLCTRSSGIGLYHSPSALIGTYFEVVE